MIDPPSTAVVATVAGALTAGGAFGLSAGLSPGPTNTLVIGQTVRYGAREGLKVAIAPLLTDAPIVAVCLGLLSRLGSATVVAWLAVAGGVVLGWLALECARAAPPVVGQVEGPARSVLKGVLANTLNPHPWLFWGTVGAPLLLGAWRRSAAVALIFLVAMYGVMVGSKMTLAWLVAGGRHRLQGRAYRVVMLLLAAVLAGYAVGFVRFGWRALS